MHVATFFLMPAISLALLEVNYPLSLQFPPVARVGTAYNFQLAPTTFQSSSEALQYSIANGPSWLHIHNKNRTLWGTPGVKDVGIISFVIAASGEAGAVANMESRLMVKDGEDVKANTNISEQLSKAGQLSDSRTLTVLPSRYFDIRFDQSVFQTNGKNLTYHTTLADHTPIPSWISFDAQSLRFSGTSPFVSTPETFKILLIASDTPGFSEVSLSFDLDVSAHQLYFTTLNDNMTFPKGESLHIKGLKERIYLDNNLIQDEGIQSATAELPWWLSFDNRSLEITGYPPSGVMSQKLVVTVQDRFGDSAKHLIHLTFPSELFAEEIGKLSITSGKPFEYKIPKSILTENSERISFDFGNLQEWLSFDPSTLTISGTVPKDTKNYSVDGEMTATSGDGKAKDTQMFKMDVRGDSSAKDPSIQGNPDKQESPKGKSVLWNRRKVGIIAGSVISALFGVTLVVAVCYLVYRRRKKHEKGYLSPATPRGPRKADISRPIPPIRIDNGWEEADREEYADLEKGKTNGSPGLTLEHPPRIVSPSTSIGESENEMVTKFHMSSMGFVDESGPSHHPYDSMRIPNKILRESMNTLGSHERQKPAASPDSDSLGSMLPSKCQREEFENGRRVYSSSRSASSYTTATNSMSMVSTVPSAYPQPPKANRHTTQLTAPIERRKSIRPPTYTMDRAPDRPTMHEKLNDFIRQRASAEAPFLASRISSSSYKSRPAFIGDPNPLTQAPPVFLYRNIVKPSDKIIEGSSRDIEPPSSPRIRKPADTPSPISEKGEFPGSLRKIRPVRSFKRKNRETSDSNRGRPLPPPPETIVYLTSDIKRSSTPEDIFRLKESLNRELDARIYDETELSERELPDSVRGGMDQDDRRATVILSPRPFFPLESKPESIQQVNSRDSRDPNQKTWKCTSQRDSTPYPHAFEHSGKANCSSTYSETLSKNVTFRSSTAKSNPHSRKTSSPSHPKTSRGMSPTQHSRQSIRKPFYSRPQSRHSDSIPKRLRGHERTQSSSYPRVEAIRGGQGEKGGQGTMHDENRTDHKDPSFARASLKLESFENHRSGLDGSIARKSARYARSARLHTSPYYHSNRGTSIPLSTISPCSVVGLGVNIPVKTKPIARPESSGKYREPLSVLNDGNGGSPGRTLICDSRGDLLVHETKDVGAVEYEETRLVSREGRFRKSKESIWSTQEQQAFI